MVTKKLPAELRLDWDIAYCSQWREDNIGRNVTKGRNGSSESGGM